MPFFYLVKSPGDALPQVMEIPPQYISAIDASEKYKTTNDHITSLYRRGKVHGLIVGRSCYVDENSLKFYFADIKKKKDEARKNLSEKLKEEYAQQATEKQKTAVPSSTQKSYAYQFALSTVVLVVLTTSVLSIQKPHFEHYSQEAGVLQSIGSFMGRLAGLFTQSQPTLTQTSTTPIIIPNTSNEFITTNSSVNRPIVHNTYPVTQRIIERVITTTTPATSGVSEAELKTKLDEVYRTFALVMSGFGEPNHTTVTTITNTVSGSYLPLSGGTLTGTLALTGATTTAVSGIDIASGCFSINGVCITANTTISSSEYPFPLLGNATSTLTQFNGGLTAYASSTIGSGLQTDGLTINGGATTTGNAYFAGRIGVGTTSNEALLQTGAGDVIFGGNSSTTGSFKYHYDPNISTQWFGIYDGNNQRYYGISSNLPAPAGTATVGGYYYGMGIGGATSTGGNPIFGVLNATQSSNGIGRVAFTVYANNTVHTFNNVLDSGVGRMGLSSSTPFAQLSVHAPTTSTTTMLFAVASSTSATASNTFFNITNVGTVGVGTTSPWAQLSINPNNLSGPAFAIGSSTATNFVVTNAGNVGIGSTSPSTALSVSGSGWFSNGLSVGSGAPAPTAGGLYVQRASAPFISFVYGATQVGQLRANSSNYFGLTSGNGNADYLDVVTTGTTAGNVGIGTTSPWAKLSINNSTNDATQPLFAIASSTATATTTLFSIDNTGLVSVSNTAFNSINTSGGVNATSGFFAGTNQGFSWNNSMARILGKGLTNDTTNYISFLIGTSSGIERARFLNTGQFGIGTSSPFALTSIHAVNGAGTSTILFAIASSTQTATSTLFTVDNTGAASTTYLYGAGLASCSGSNALTWSSGLFGCTNVGASAFAFTPTTTFGSAANATSTLIGFTNGIYATASSTIGGGTQITGLTINGGATTTGDAYFNSGLYMRSGSISLNGNQRLYLLGTNGVIDSNWSFGADLNPNINVRGFSTGARSFRILDSANSDAVRFAINFGTGASYLTGGNFGIGTTSPWGKLSINNTTNDTAGQPLFTIASSTATATSTLFVVNNVGQVGINTSTFGTGVGGTNPLLYVNGGSVFGPGQTVRSAVTTFSLNNSATYSGSADIGDANRSLNVVNENSTTNAYAPLSFRVNPGGGANNAMLDMKFVNPNTGSSNLIFTYRDQSSFIDRYAFGSNGNIGISTTSPLARLTIVATSTATNIPLLSLQTPTTLGLATTSVFTVDANGSTTIGLLGSGIVASNNGLLYSTASSTMFGTGTGGQILTWNNGVPQWVASTTYASGTGISTSFANGQLTINNTGVTSLTAGAGIGLSGSTGNVTITNLYGFPFTPTTAFGSAANATSTLIGFLNGIYATASSTIGGGTQATGLTINGGATTTGNAYFAGTVAIGDTNAYQGKIWAKSGDIWTSGNNLRLAFSTDSSTDNTPNVSILASGNDTVFKSWTGSIDKEKVRILGATGYVGIGTSSPFANLALANNASSTSLYTFLLASTTNVGGTFSTSTLFSVANTGTAYFSKLVGVGTTSPFAKLSVSANFGDIANVLFAIGSTTSSASTTNLFSVTNTGNVGLNNNAALTFGTLYGTGSTGYGIRENGGMIEFRNAYASTTALASNWTPISSAASVRYQLNETGWVNTGATLPGNLGASQAIVIGDYAYLFGGFDNSAYTNIIYRAPISNPTAWVNTGATIPGNLAFSQAVVVGDYIYLFGGVLSSTASNVIYRAPVSNPTAWVNTGATLPGTLSQSQAVVIGDYIYLFGGSNSAGTTLNVIYRAPVSNPTSWVNTGAVLPGVLMGSQAAVIGDYIYLFGGSDAVTATNVIYRAPVSNPTAWTTTGASIPKNLSVAQVITVGDYVYLIGGFASSMSNTMYRAPVSNPTAWVPTGATLPSNLSHSQAVIIGDNVYLFGGFNGSSYTNIIYRAPITSSASTYDKGWAYRLNTPTGPWFQATSTNNNLSYLSGNVGVGSTSPFALLSLFANNSTTTGSIVAPATLFAIGSTTGAATSTLFSVSNTGAASTTQLFGAGLASCSGSSALTWSSGLFGCSNVGAAAFPFTPTTAFGSAANATSTLTGFLSGIYATASSTIGNGTQIGGLTINGGATTTGNAYFAGTVNIASSFTAGVGLNFDGTSNLFLQNGGSYSFGSIYPSYLTGTDGNGSGYLQLVPGNTPSVGFIIKADKTAGFSTSTPWAQLSINPNGITGPAFAIGSSTATSFVVTNAGNVGIGTSSPETTLTVVGAICAARGFGVQTTACGTQAGTIYANNSSLSGGYDLAETYPITDQSIESGDVVAFDTSTSTTIMKAGGTSPTFLGVVSTQPALLLGTLSSSTRPVALSGRVPVKVSLEHGAISVGDRLTISTTTPGVAVRAITTGQTIGVALEPITTVTGTTTPTIVAFINPQFTLSPSDNEALAALLSPATSTAPTNSSVLAGFFSHITAWLGDIANGIGDIFAKSFHAKDSICIDDQCLNKDDIRALLQMTRTQTTGTSAAPTSTTDTGAPAPSTPPDTQAPATDTVPADSSTAAPTNSASSEQN